MIHFPFFFFNLNFSCTHIFTGILRGLPVILNVSAYIPHIPILLEMKLERAGESDSELLKFVLCENLFSNPSSTFLAKFLDFHVLFADSLEFIFFSPTLSEIELGWMSTCNTKSSALCTKNICSSKYFFPDSREKYEPRTS